jgi:hypothetical protein
MSQAGGLRRESVDPRFELKEFQRLDLDGFSRVEVLQHSVDL